MQTVDEIIIRADPEAIFRVAADVEQWPAILPHYRWVKILARYGTGCTVEMAAWRGWIPVRWTAIQSCVASQRCIYYRHIGGATMGMDVVWRIEPEGDAVRVSIVHELTLQRPVMRSKIGLWIIGNLFVRYIAIRTLAHMKRNLEQKEAAICVAQSLPGSDR